MRTEELRKLHRQVPFSGLEITLENGESYTVRHPEQLFITELLIGWVRGKSHAFFTADKITSVRSLNGPTSGRDGNSRRR